MPEERKAREHARRAFSSVKTLLLVAALIAAPALGTAETPEQLKAEAYKLAREHLARMPEGYHARIDVDRRLVYVSALDEAHLKETMVLLAVYTDAQRKVLLSEPLAWNVTVLLPEEAEYRKLAPDLKTTGFYRYADHTLISIDRGRVLLHEFTHALHHADAAAAGQTHPIWICEGIATLFESASVVSGELSLSTDSRLIHLQRALRLKTLVPLEKLMKMETKAFVEQADLCYAQSRYLLYYLHENGLLRKWYAAYKAGFDKDPTGRAALEKVCGKHISAIEEDWREWAGELKLPWGELRRGQARLGIEMQDHNRGVKVVRLLPGGAALKGGRLRKGDIIRAFNGTDVSSAAELINAIRASGAHQTVKIDLYRNGRELTVLQPLGAAGG